jgi:hypothetical protein
MLLGPHFFYGEKHFQDGSVEPQIPPLRSVGMTKERAALSLRMSCRFLHVCCGRGQQPVADKSFVS